VYYNFRCDIAGTGMRSVSQNWLVIVLKYVIKVDIKASSLQLQFWYNKQQEQEEEQQQTTTNASTNVVLIVQKQLSKLQTVLW